MKRMVPVGAGIPGFTVGVVEVEDVNPLAQPSVTVKLSPDWRAIAEKLAGALRGVEWSAGRRGHWCDERQCGACDAEHEDGHTTDCAVNGALAEFDRAKGQTP